MLYLLVGLIGFSWHFDNKCFLCFRWVSHPLHVVPPRLWSVTVSYGNGTWSVNRSEYDQAIQDVTNFSRQVNSIQRNHPYLSDLILLARITCQRCLSQLIHAHKNVSLKTLSTFNCGKHWHLWLRQPIETYRRRKRIKREIFLNFSCVAQPFITLSTAVIYHIKHLIRCESFLLDISMIHQL